MVRTGMATFHQVMALFTLLNRRIARKLTAVKTAMSRAPDEAPPVTLPVVSLTGRASSRTPYCMNA